MCYVVGNQMYAGMQTAGFTPTELAPAGNVIGILGDMNHMLIYLFFGLQIATIISAFAIKSHPIFFFMFFIIQVIALILAPTMTDIYASFYNDPTLSMYSSQFSLIKALMDNLQIVMLAISILVGIAMFAFPRGAAE
jgi:hypothetical protein